MLGTERPDSTRISTVVIVGGGTAGWMTAAALATHLAGTPVRITLIESSDIGTIGVGEATIPTIRRFYARLGMRDADVMRACDATAKLGIRFDGWAGAGSSFVHPFGHFGQDVRGVEFHHLWLRARALGDATPIERYSLGALLARHGHATTPVPHPPTRLSVFDWALHLDATKFAAHLRAHAEAMGVQRIDARIDAVPLHPDGTIRAVRLSDGHEVTGDLFIDCSGFRAMLIGEALGVGHEDWSHWLLCDGAWAVPSANAGPPPSCTTVTARTAGWQWRIPLRGREGNGMVFSSRFQDEDAARDELMAALAGPALAEPRRLRFRPGRRSRAWAGNCVAIGLAGGFLEPLESTSIALIETAIERLKQLFPDRRMAPELAAEFNEQTAEEMERVRDFLILHYALNRRTGAFWDACRAMELPDTLRRKIALWRARGAFVRYRWEMFAPASWLAIYAGFDCWPDAPDPAADGIDARQLLHALAGMRDALARTVADTPDHREFLTMIDDIAAQPRPQEPVA